MNDLAKEVAHSSVFQNANHYRKRYAMERILGDRLPTDRSHADEVLERASSIWEVDLQPSQDAALRAKITGLKQQGMKAAEIVEQLGIDMRRYKNLIGAK